MATRCNSPGSTPLALRGCWPQERQQLLEMGAPAGPVMAAGQLLVEAAASARLERLCQFEIHGDKALFVLADVEIERLRRHCTARAAKDAIVRHKERARLARDGRE